MFAMLGGMVGINWKKLYSVIKAAVMISLVSAFGSLFWSFVFMAMINEYLELDDDAAMMFIFIPTFIGLFFLLLIKMERPLRRAGMLSDDPERFGPWFKSDESR